MSRYTPDSRERVREAVDFAELVGARTELRRAGVNRLTGLCPFHDERSPSFGIDPVEKLYHCFGCGAGGDVFSFVMETEGLTFPEALESLAERYGVQLERSEEDPRAAERRARRDRLLALLERTAAFYVRLLWESDEAAPARAYLESRGLGEDALREFRVGYSPAAWERVASASLAAGFSEGELLAAGLAQRSRGGGRLVDRFRGRLMFPLCDARGRVLGFGARSLREEDRPKYLNSAEGEVFSKGRMVFGVHLARAAAAREGRVVLVEGYTDALALHQAGLRATVASMGTALTEDQARELARLAGTVVLCLDADAAGQEAMAKAAAALGAVAGAGRDVVMKVAALPAGSDPADVLAAEGASGMVERIEAAVPLAQWQVARALAGDLSAPEARDAALDAAAAIVVPMPPSVLKEELIRIVAGRLALSEELAAVRLRERAPGRSAHPPSPAAAARRERGDQHPERGGAGTRPVREAERAFLALCIALPEEAARRLAADESERLLASPLHRRAAEHLRGHAATPAAGLPPDDAELPALVAELVMRARAMPDPSPSQLDRAVLHLELARLERHIAAARLDGGPLSDLARERQTVLAELRRLTR